MRKKLIFGLIFILCLTIITACGEKVKEEPKKEEETKQVEKFKQNVTEVEKDENGEIISGVIENYKFTETDKVTDRVKIQMEDDSIILIVLSNSSTPKTIANFQNLVKEKFYDGVNFHRIYKGFMIQGGDKDGSNENKIKGEFSSNGVNNTLSHTRGVISMARATDPDSASTQFFIMHADSTFLDGNYASFGRVFAGMDAVDNIANAEVVANPYMNGEMSKPVNPPVMKSIRFIEIEKIN